MASLKPTLELPPVGRLLRVPSDCLLGQSSAQPICFRTRDKTRSGLEQALAKALTDCFNSSSRQSNLTGASLSLSKAVPSLTPG